MRTVYFLAVVLCLPATAASQTKESIVPAGTLLRCTVDEPKFSSQTAQAGDPVLCHVASLGMFGEPVFPRGAYLSGRLEGFRDPGHFYGKGWMKLEFDHISLPDTVLPVPVKLVGVRGYRVDREEKILGRGHAKRDAVEWLIPPLWPWKVLSLPARGPRPTLKGETQFTLRLMEDVAVPLDNTAGKGIGAGGVETVDTAGGLVGEVDEPFVAHYVCSSERSGDAQAFCHGLFNDTSGVVRGGFEASG